MNTILILNTLATWWRRLAGRIQEARRARRALQELSRMSAHELRDIGMSHAAPGATARDECRGA